MGLTGERLDAGVVSTLDGDLCRGDVTDRSEMSPFQKDQTVDHFGINVVAQLLFTHQLQPLNVVPISCHE